MGPTPPSGSTTPPHAPDEEPGANTQGVPGQQSAWVVQAPATGTQLPGSPHTKPPVGLGVHGLPQQSALEAHAVPAGGAPPAQSIGAVRHRGTPRASCWQRSGFCCTVPEQHRSVALHDVVASLQMEPAGLQRLPLSHFPTGSDGFLRAQVTSESVPSGSVADPQQSPSDTQISPVGRQPLAGWQIDRPEGAYTAHFRLQHDPPQVVDASKQRVPAGAQLGLPGTAGTAPHTPSVAPPAIVQVPEQQSVFRAHASPTWVQNDGRAEHTPPLQKLEQHSVSAAHGLPAVRHAGFSG